MRTPHRRRSRCNVGSIVLPFIPNTDIMIYYFSVYPLDNKHLYLVYYYKDALKFDAQFIGLLGTFEALANGVGALVFGIFAFSSLGHGLHAFETAYNARWAVACANLLTIHDLR